MGLVPPISEHIPKVHAGIIPSVQVGTRAGFERHMDSSRMENSNSATATWAHSAGETSSRRMFSSCVSTDQGFCFRKPWRERFFRCFRRFSAQLGCLWSFTRRSPKGSSPDCRQELVHGAPCSISLREGPEPHTSNRAQGGHRGESVSTGDRNETYSVWSVRRRRLEMLVDNLVPAFLGGDPAYLPTFLGTYRAFGTTQQVLDLLFMRYGCILPYCDEDGGPLHQLKMAMASILGTWLHLYPEDFQQAPEFPCLKMLLAYVELNMPDSDLEQQARYLLAQLETLEPTEAEGHDPASAGEEALETSPDLTPTAPLMPATAPHVLSATHSPLLVPHSGEDASEEALVARP
nr:PREDICTED: ral guanine nucleotide dissociation stimulator-like [Bos mutus]